MEYNDGGLRLGRAGEDGVRDGRGVDASGVASANPVIIIFHCFFRIMNNNKK